MLATTLRLTQNEEDQLIRLMSNTRCTAHYACLSKEPHELCDAKSIDSDSFLECLDEDGRWCRQSLSYALGEALCKCPIRVYLKRHFGI
jgi:hypothetical protein